MAAANSPSILTHQKFSGPLVIVDIIQRTGQNIDTMTGDVINVANSEIGPAYRLCDPSSGRNLRYLVPACRLKVYECDRARFRSQHPPFEQKPTVAVDEPTDPDPATQPNPSPTTQPQVSDVSRGEFHDASHIIHKRRFGNETKYLVRFCAGDAAYVKPCDCSNRLIAEFLHKETLKRKLLQRRRRALLNL